MVWQSFQDFVSQRLFKPLLSFLVHCICHPFKTLLFLFKLLAIFVLVSIISTVFIFSYAADDHVLAKNISPSNYAVLSFYDKKFYFVTGTTFPSACVQAGGSYVPWSDSQPDYMVCRRSGYYTVSLKEYSCSTKPPPAEYASVCNMQYICPPDDKPDYTVGPIDLNGQKVCYKRSCTSSNNWFDSSMALGKGTACSFGCQYTVTASYVSSTGNNAFIGKGTGETCSCTGKTRCWQNFTPNTDSDNDETGTCYAWDLGEVKGVDCGKNGEMTVDLAPINESLNAMSEKNQEQDDAIKQNSDWIFDNTADIQDLKVDVEKLKEMGCSVTQQANGVLINCNGTSAIAVNGEKGEKGDKGDQGASGGIGPKGETGEKGDKGDAGQQGAQGEKGDTGEKGDKGDQGEKGETGATGEQGIAGRDGIDGKDGAQGVQGIQGVQGVKGEDGKDGEDGDSVLAVQNGDDVDLVSASTGARMATLKGIDRDGIIEAIDQGNATLEDILQAMQNSSSAADPSTEFDVDYGEQLGGDGNDWETRNFSTVMDKFVTDMKQTELFETVGKYFSVNFSGACAPLQFDFTVFDKTFSFSVDPFCTFEYWEYIQAVVMMVFGFFAFRVAIDN